MEEKKTKIMAVSIDSLAVFFKKLSKSPEFKNS
jgi:hypothetical protein